MKADNDNGLRHGPWLPDRAMAKAFGSKMFSTGIVCSVCGDDVKYTSDGQCVSCSLRYRREYYERNADEIKRKAREKHHENRDRNLDRMREYTKKNSERRAPQRKIYSERNRDHRIQMAREWHRENKDRATQYRQERLDIYAAHARNRRFLKVSNGGSHTADDIAAILRRQKYKCVECGASVRKRENRHVDHIMPLALGGSNDPSNLQVLCPSCNMSKGALHPIEFANRRGRLL